MSELRQPPSPKAKRRRLAVRVGPHEVRYFESERELDAAISQEDIQRGLDLAGAWSDLNISEEEMLRAFDKIRS